MKQIPMEIKQLGVTIPETELLAFIGVCAGEAYASSKDEEACIKRALNCIKRGHHSPWEHASITLLSTVDRGTSHALVRHRHCAVTQSSTIYQKLNEVAVIEDENYSENMLHSFRSSEIDYLKELNSGRVPGEARDVLPIALATNVIITTNIRQWMYMLQRRNGPGDSSKMHRWNKMLREWFEKQYPRITLAFDTWYEKHPL
jgi:thymidylate synthase (FAD)